MLDKIQANNQDAMVTRSDAIKTAYDLAKVDGNIADTETAEIRGLFFSKN